MTSETYTLWQSNPAIMRIKANEKELGHQWYIELSAMDWWCGNCPAVYGRGKLWKKRCKGEAREESE